MSILHLVPRGSLGPADILPKLRLTSAFSTGSKLFSLFKGDLDLSALRPVDIHARIQTAGTALYGVMRRAAMRSISSLTDANIVADGLVSKKIFVKELRQSKLCFSPFGYGEICWRDFEAFATGAVMLKPDMSHLQVMGDVCRPWETYTPIA